MGQAPQHPRPAPPSDGGGSSYEITSSGQEPPINGFWSLTLYNDKPLFHPNDLRRRSLGTKNKHLKRNPNGSLVLYAGTKSPGGEREANWLPAPNGRFSLHIRAYWGKEGILDGSLPDDDSRLSRTHRGVHDAPRFQFGGGERLHAPPIEAGVRA